MKLLHDTVYIEVWNKAYDRANKRDQISILARVRVTALVKHKVGRAVILRMKLQGSMR